MTKQCDEDALDGLKTKFPMDQIVYSNTKNSDVNNTIKMGRNRAVNTCKPSEKSYK